MIPLEKKPVFQRTLLSSAVAVACYGGAAQAACPGTVTTAEGACVLTPGGSVTVTSSGSLQSLSVPAGNAGTVDNAGEIGTTASSTSALSVSYDTDLSGTLTNSGLIRLDMTGASTSTSLYPKAIQIGNDLSGTLTNTGTITASVTTGTASNVGAQGVSITNELSGTLTNEGIIRARVQSAGSGSSANVSAYGIYAGSVAEGGLLDNSGVIEGLADNSKWASTIAGVYVNGDMDGTILNTGTIQGIAELGPDGPSGGTAYGIYIGGELGASGTLDNQGTIKAFVEGSTSGGTAYGLYVADQLHGSITNSGLIEAESLAQSEPSGQGGRAAGLHIDSAVAETGSITNEGTIQAAVNGSNTRGTAYGIYTDHDLDGSITNKGLISATAEAGGTSNSGATGHAYGLYIDDDLNGTLDNQGTIMARVQASGTSWSASAFARGASIEDDLEGEFVNSGLISAEFSATALATAENAGGSVYGVWIRLDMNGSFENSGTISARGVANGTGAGATSWVGASAFGVHHGSDLNGSFTNSGTITAHAEANGGYHSSLSARAFGVRVDGNVQGSVVNSGLIEATATMTGARGTGSETAIAYGIYIGNDLEGAIDNSGTIIATVDAGAATSQTAYALFVNGDSSLGTVTNSGTIVGDVQLNGGTLNLNGGVIDGAITSLNALDINVGGEHKSSAIDIAGANVDDFAVVNGGNWVLDAPIQDVTTFTVNGTGLLTFAKSSVGLTEDVSGTGTVAVNSGVDATLTGNYTQGAGGTFEVQTLNADSIGRLTVTGTADLSASNQVSVDVQGLLEVDAPIDDILTAGTLTAGPLTTTDNSLFYTLTASVDGNTVDLNVERDLLVADAVAAADLPYAEGIATALDQLLTNGGTGQGIDGIMVALGNLSGSEEVAEAVAQMLPVGAPEATTAARQSVNQFSNVVGNRITGQRGLSAGDGGMYEEGHMWVKPFGGFAEQDRRSGVPGYESNTVGIGFGGDVTNGRLLLGAGFAWSDTEVDSNTISRNELDVESYQLVFYGNYDLDETSFVEGYAMVGWNENDSLRDINFGAFNATAKGDFDSIFTRVYAGVGRDYKQNERFTLTPVATLRYTYIDQDGYTEDGAGALNLIVDDVDEDSLILGLDAVGTYRLDLDGTYVMSIRAGVGYDALNDRTLVTSTLAGGGGAFATNGAKADEFVYRAGLGLKATPKALMSVRLDYEFEGRSDYRSHGGSINFRWQF